MRALRTKSVPSTSSHQVLARTSRQNGPASLPGGYPTQLQHSSGLEHPPLASNQNETPSSFTGEDATRRTPSSGPLLPPSAQSPSLGSRGYPVAQNSIPPDTKQAPRGRLRSLMAWDGAGDAPAPLSPKSPARVKPSEVAMLNPVWIDIQANPEEFVAHEDVPYLWAQREDGHVVLGVEEPWKYPHAFAESAKPMLEKMKKHYEAQAEHWRDQGIKDGSGGHPTVAARIESTGVVSTPAGSAFLGGELRYNKRSNQWVLNNYSGRFGRGDELKDGSVKKASVQQTLDEVATCIQQQTGLGVSARVMGKRMFMELQVERLTGWVRRKTE